MRKSKLNMSFVFEQTPVAYAVFTVAGMLHFFVSISGLIMTAECLPTLFVGMGFGGAFVPVVLLLAKTYDRARAKTTTIAMFVSAMCAASLCMGGCAYGVQRLNAVCPERLLFMAFLNGLIIPGIIASFFEMVKITSAPAALTAVRV